MKFVQLTNAKLQAPFYINVDSIIGIFTTTNGGSMLIVGKESIEVNETPEQIINEVNGIVVNDKGNGKISHS